MSEVTTARPSAPAPVQVGIGTSFVTLLRWNLAQIGALLPLVVVVQALLAAGIIIGFGFIIPDIDPGTALFLSTGAPTVAFRRPTRPRSTSGRATAPAGSSTTCPPASTATPCSSSPAR